jgi:zinc transporter ZupT
MLVAFVAAGLACCASAQHAHGAGDLNFEWAGIFETGENLYMWTAQKVEGAYADASMKLAALPTTVATDAELHRLESEGIHALEETCVEVSAGGTIVPEMDKCYKLNFDQNMWQSLFMVDASATGAVAFFAEHVPTEFEATAHYLKDDHGDDIEPVAELPEETVTAPAEEKHWGGVIGSSICVQLVTLIGVALAIPPIRKSMENYRDQVMAILSGFAAGAIIACAFFLLLFEATHLVAVGWDEEVDVLWRWGTMILVGFALPAFVDIATTIVRQAVIKDQPAEPTTVNASEPNKAGDAAVAVGSFSTRARLWAGVIIGDFFHNLCDGFFIAAAFKGCGTSFGWQVALSTVLHELPQEISDYVILTGPGINLSPLMALVWNFLSGLSVILGAIIVNSGDVSQSDIGLLLAFGGGLYLHIAATECMPRIYKEGLSLNVRVASMSAFVLGAVLIGLVLLDHEHCVPASAEGGGGGGHHH